MGGERAQEMHNIWDPPASETSTYFATHTCKKTQAVVQRHFRGNKARKSGRYGDKPQIFSAQTTAVSRTSNHQPNDCAWLPANAANRKRRGEEDQ
jgi:hypothetical protein